MSKKYDIILIECVYNLQLHYNMDVKNLAELLIACGYRVAVINYLKSNTYHNERKYEVINLDIPENKLNYSTKTGNNKFKNTISEIKQDYLNYKLFHYIFNKIYDLSDNFYIGSLRSEIIPILFLKKIINKQIFVWGLRSHFLIPNNKSLVKIKVNFKKFLLKRLSRRRELKIFVSNEMIQNDFLEIGFNEYNLIVRPERFLNSVNYKTKKNRFFTIANLGSLRKDKNILLLIDAVSKISDVKYIIAGRCEENYKELLKKKIREVKNPHIIRKDGFLSNVEYYSIFHKSDFFIFADFEESSTKTNGTFVEAIFNSTPVIAPNYPSYSYFVNKYDIGILYEPENEETLIKAIEKAKNLKTDYFKDGIIKFQQDHLIENVANKLKQQLIKVL